MFIESLDARRLMVGTTHYANGRDPTFADDGHLTFHGFVPGYSLAYFYPSTTVIGGPDGGTFVAGSDGQQYRRLNRVAKLDADGKIDPSWGSAGYAAIPQEATQLAYDAAEGYLYVGSNGASDGDAGPLMLSVTRLTHRGRVDRSFGTDGTFTYLPPIPEGGTATSSVEAINPLPDGSAVLAVDRDSSSAETSDQNLALIKLRPDGTRDPHYGKKGVVQLIGGSVTPTEYVGSDPNGVKSLVKRGFFSDVRTGKNGETTALIRYEDGSVTQSTETAQILSDEADQGRLDLKSRTVSAAGVEETDQARSWTLLDTGDDKDLSFQINYIGPDRQSVRAVVHVSDFSGVTDGAGGKSSAYLYTLNAERRPTRVPFAPAGLKGLSSLSRSADGQYVASDDTHIVRLRKNFTRDPTFADHGLATAGGDLFGTYYFGSENALIDGQGRVFAFEYDKSVAVVMERFD